MSLPGDLTCGHLDLGKSGRAWMMACYEPMNDYEKEFAAGFLDTMRLDYQADPSDVEGAVLSIQLDDEPMVANIPLGWEHVYIGGRPRIS